MSGLFSREAEEVLSAQEAEDRRSHYQTIAHDPCFTDHASRAPYQQQWTTALHPAMASTHSQPSPYVFSTPAQYMPWPSLDPNPVTGGQYTPPAPHVIPPSPYSSDQHWSNGPWPTLHPEDAVVPSNSRSVSPNPADLHNFGLPSQMAKAGVVLIQLVPLKPNSRGVAIYVSIIGVIPNLFSAATKTVLNQRRADSRQAKIGTGMNQKYSPLIRVARSCPLTSRMKHKPGVPCTNDECERIFSRVDNMKDHVRRIHRKPS